MEGPSLLDPVRLVVPKGDPYYGPGLIVRANSYSDPATAWAYSRVDGLWASVGFCVMFLALRWTWNYAFSVLFRRRARCAAAGRQGGDGGRGAPRSASARRHRRRRAGRAPGSERSAAAPRLPRPR
jgi:hypothetical protein